jgi:hypothetical protein
VALWSIDLRAEYPIMLNDEGSLFGGIFRYAAGNYRKVGSLITAAGFTVGVFSRCMKGQRIRYRQTGEFHFLTFSCYRRRPYLVAVAAMELFEDALERVRERYRFVVAGYVACRNTCICW